MSPTIIATVYTSGSKITATLRPISERMSADGWRVSIAQDGVRVGEAHWNGNQITDIDARLGADDGSETEEAYRDLDRALCNAIASAHPMTTNPDMMTAAPARVLGQHIADYLKTAEAGAWTVGEFGWDGARDFAEPSAPVVTDSSGPAVVPCSCGCGGTAVVFEGDDTFYQEGKARNGRPDESLRRYAERHVRQGANMVPASDDWHPCFPHGLVAVRWFPFPDGRGRRVCVWGADNTGMERDFFGEDAEEAARRCRQSFPVYLCRDTLRDMGFVRA